MKKFIHFILLGLFIIPGVLADAQDPKTLSVSVNDAVPTIDGVVDDLWNAIAATPADSLNVGAVDSDADFSVTFKTTFNYKYFFALIEVTDDVLDNAHVNSYERDLVELYFDMDNSKNILDPPYAPWPATAYDANDTQLTFIWNSDNSDLLGGAVVSAQVDTDDGWLIEIRIPWEALMETFVPADGTIIGFDVNCGDNDGADREAKLSWNMWEDEAWRDPHYMGNMELLAYVPHAVITEFVDNFENAAVWEGWDMNSATHTISEADGMLTIAVDKPTDAEKWDGITMGFGDNTVIDLTANGWFSVDLKSDINCLVDISVFDLDGEYNPGNNQLQLTGGGDWATMKFEHAGDNLIHYQWDGAILGTVDASVVDHLLMTFDGGSVWSGTVNMDNMQVGIGGPDPTDITFIVDDSQNGSHTALAIKGSWDTSTGEYDAGWTDGAEHSPFYDDGTHGDVTADDHIWTVTLAMIPDGGANNWEWGVNDADGNWIDGNFGFTVTDETAQTLDPYYIESSAAITFIVDATMGKSHTAFALKGSWDTESGRYDAEWTDGAEHADFYDDGTHGDETAGDYIWTVTLDLIYDGGANNWEWGVNDASGTWIDGNFAFTVVDNSAQTLDAFVITAVDLSRYADYNVYPNPASSTIFIDNSNEISTVELINMSGQVTMKHVNSGNATMSISVENQYSGIYMLRITDHNNEVNFQKLIIE